MGLRSLHASPWTTEQKEESMNKATRDRIIGIDVSRDCLDIYCLPGGHRLRLPNTDEGHARLVDWRNQAARWFVLRPPADRNGVYGPPWTPRGSRHGNCLPRKSRPSWPVGAHGPRLTGLTRNSLRGSWLSGPMQGAPFRMERYAFSEPRRPSVVSWSKHANGCRRRSGRMESWDRRVCSKPWMPR